MGSSFSSYRDVDQVKSRYESSIKQAQYDYATAILDAEADLYNHTMKVMNSSGDCEYIHYSEMVLDCDRPVVDSDVRSIMYRLLSKYNPSIYRVIMQHYPSSDTVREISSTL